MRPKLRYDDNIVLKSVIKMDSIGMHWPDWLIIQWTGGQFEHGNKAP
jgi:hypothetical protein